MQGNNQKNGNLIVLSSGVKLSNQNRLREFDEVNLNTVLIEVILPYLERMIGLTGEKSADRMEMALMGMRDLCKGMSIADIKRMIEMYVDGNMSMEPRANYFDRILLAKMVQEYKRSRKKKVIEEMRIPQAEMERIMEEAISRGREDWIQRGIMELGSSRYDYLDKKGRIQSALGMNDQEWADFKKRKFEEAHQATLHEAQNRKVGSFAEKKSLKSFLIELEKKTSGIPVKKAKEQILKLYYEITE